MKFQISPLSGYESKHNSKYWTLDAVVGFGCSAHSFDGVNVRYANERDTARYVEMIENKARQSSKKARLKRLLNRFFRFAPDTRH
jgi:oxygen-independent coproporphyrinogen-3 oxidase